MILTPSNKNNQVPNVEAERGETILMPSGILAHISGKSHANGGTEITAETGAKIFSKVIKLPKQIVAELMGKKPSQVVKTSPADLSKKYDTSKYIDTINDSSKDQIAKDTAEIMLKKNQAQLDTIFEAQESFKKDNGIEQGRLMTNEEKQRVTKYGGQITKAQSGNFFPSRNFRGYLPIDDQDNIKGQDKTDYLSYFKPNGEIVTTDIPYEVDYGVRMDYPLSVDSKDTYATLNYPDTQATKTRLYTWPEHLTKDANGVPLNKDNYYYHEPSKSWVSKPHVRDEVSNEYGKMLKFDRNTNTYDNSPEAQAQRRAWWESQQGDSMFTSGYEGEVYDNQTKTTTPLSNFTGDKNDKRYDFRPDSRFFGKENANNVNDGKNIDRIISGQTNQKTIMYPQKPISTLPPFTQAPTLPPLVSPGTTPEKQDTPYSKDYGYKELDELDNQRNRTILDFMGRRKLVPYLSNPMQSVAYQRYTPINTLAAEKAQTFNNMQMMNSNAPSNLQQAINADNYAKYLDNQSKTQLTNYQADLANDNQNSELYRNTNNQNLVNRDKAVGQYVRDLQIVEDQYDKDGESILDKMDSLNYDKARILDKFNAEKALSDMYNPYTKDLGKKGGKYNQRVYQNPNYERARTSNPLFNRNSNDELKTAINNMDPNWSADQQKAYLDIFRERFKS